LQQSVLAELFNLKCLSVKVSKSNKTLTIYIQARIKIRIIVASQWKPTYVELHFLLQEFCSLPPSILYNKKVIQVIKYLERGSEHQMTLHQKCNSISLSEWLFRLIRTSKMQFNHFIEKLFKVIYLVNYLRLLKKWF
jgi:hypothetical protein